MHEEDKEGDENNGSGEENEVLDKANQNYNTELDEKGETARVSAVLYGTVPEERAGLGGAEEVQMEEEQSSPLKMRSCNEITAKFSCTDFWHSS